MHEIRCRTLALTLDADGRATSLVHLATGRELLAAQSFAPALWQLSLIRPVAYDDPLPPIERPDLDYQGHESWINRLEYRGDLGVEPAPGESPEVTARDGGLALVWSVRMQGGRATVTVHIEGGDRDDLAFRFGVSLPRGWALKRVMLPRLRGFGDLGAPESDALLYATNWGVLRRNPLEDMTAFTGQYPSGSNCMQMTAWMSGQAGLYLGVLDPESRHTGIDAQYVEGDTVAPEETQRWYVDRPVPAWEAREFQPLADRIGAGLAPAVQLRVNHWPEQTGEWECPYPVVLRGFEGGWFEAASIHRAWATGQRWCRRGPLAERDDAPDSLAGIDLWFSKFGFPAAGREPTPAWGFRDAMLRLREYFGVPFGVHWYNWHAFSWHGGFPAHAPVVEGFGEVVRELQEHGIVIMPYCQGRLLYPDRAAFEQERAHATVEANGQPYLEMYTRDDDWPVALCPSDPWVRMQWHEAARMLWRQYGVEGVYFDQITAMPPNLCYHRAHGHALGGGRQHWQGYDEVLDSMEPMIEEDTGRFLSSELLADAFVDRIGLYLSFVPPLEDYVPLFGAVYGDYTNVMGRSTPGAAMEDPQLFLMVQGEQMLFGGQVGWMSDEILKHAESAALLRDMARLRPHLRDFLHVGTMLAPLDVEVSGDPLAMDLPGRMCGRKRDLPIERPAVRHTVWRAPDGRVMVLLLNESREAREVTFTPPVDWPSGEWTLRRMGHEEADPLAASPAARVTVAPLSLCACISSAS